jgi:hypothetical protein
LANTEVAVPNIFKNKVIAYSYLDIEGKPQLTRTAWLTQEMAHLLNAQRFETVEENLILDSEKSKQVRKSELYECYRNTLKTVGRLVKDDLLRDRKGPGFMAFVQANENVPQNALLVSDRTYHSCLIPSNSVWEKASSVVVTRFPNLGPHTTKELNLLVQAPFPNIYFPKIEYKQGFIPIMDCIYLNPETLKEGFQGDGDGDTLFCVLKGLNRPQFVDIDLIRKAGDLRLFDKEFEVMARKGNRQGDKPLSKYLPTYFDNTPIGLATYAIRYQLYKKAKSLQGKVEYPLSVAWEQLAPDAIDLIEFVMDIRKGEWTNQQIKSKLDGIAKIMQEIKVAREGGDWFTQTVTSSSIGSIEAFMAKYPTLQSFINDIFIQ